MNFSFLRQFKKRGLSQYKAVFDAEANKHVNQSIKDLRESYRSLGFVRPFNAYGRFIEQIRKIENLRILPLKEFSKSGFESERRIFLRNDVDADPETAVRMARFNARYGVGSSFYILHSAYYYGTMLQDTFYLNPQIKDWVKALIYAGAEIGVHSDAFCFYKQHRINGSQALETEINRLRELGACVEGTVAHNSFPVYGAENFEVFEERVIWKGRSRSGLCKVDFPLGTLSEKRLGLTYEGNFPRRVTENENVNAFNWMKSNRPDGASDEFWMRTYLVDNPYCEWGADYLFWPTKNESWIIASKKRNVYEWCVSVDRVLEVISDLDCGTRSVIIFHPIFFSGDDDEV